MSNFGGLLANTLRTNSNVTVMAACACVPSKHRTWLMIHGAVPSQVDEDDKSDADDDDLEVMAEGEHIQASHPPPGAKDDKAPKTVRLSLGGALESKCGVAEGCAMELLGV